MLFFELCISLSLLLESHLQAIDYRLKFIYLFFAVFFVLIQPLIFQLDLNQFQTLLVVQILSPSELYLYLFKLFLLFRTLCQFSQLFTLLPDNLCLILLFLNLQLKLFNSALKTVVDFLLITKSLYLRYEFVIL